jgi:hypothetical protein
MKCKVRLFPYLTFISKFEEIYTFGKYLNNFVQVFLGLFALKTIASTAAEVMIIIRFFSDFNSDLIPQLIMIGVVYQISSLMLLLLVIMKVEVEDEDLESEICKGLTNFRNKRALPLFLFAGLGVLLYFLDDLKENDLQFFIVVESTLLLEYIIIKGFPTLGALLMRTLSFGMFSIDHN